MKRLLKIFKSGRFWLHSGLALFLCLTIIMGVSGFSDIRVTSGGGFISLQVSTAIAATPQSPQRIESYKPPPQPIVKSTSVFHGSLLNTVRTDNASSSTSNWTNPTNAYADGGGAATVTSGSPSVTQTYGNYNIVIAGNVVTDVRVRLDAWTTGTSSTNVTKEATSDDANTGGFTSTNATRYQAINDSSDTSYITGVTNGGGYATFGYTAFTVAANSTITNVAVYYRHRSNTTGTAASSGTVLKVGGTYYGSGGTLNAYTDNGTASEPASGSAIADRTYLWTINPKSGVAWTADDVNGTGANALQFFGVGGTDFNPDVNFYKCNVTVNYTTAANENIELDVSWDGGTTWSASKHSNPTTGSEVTYWDNVTSDTTWTTAKLTDANFKTRVDALTVGDAGTMNLDWIPVEVTYITLAPPSSFAATSRTSSSIALSWTKGAGADNTTIRYRTDQYPTGTSDGTLAYSGTGTSTNVTGLSAGQIYYFRAWSYNNLEATYSSSTSDLTDYTLPGNPSNLASTSVTDNSIAYSWTKGTGGDKTMLRYRSDGTFPTGTGDGTQAYFDTGTSTNVTGLSPATNYYFRAWAYDSDSTYYSAGTSDNIQATAGTGWLFGYRYRKQISINGTTAGNVTNYQLPLDVMSGFDSNTMDSHMVNKGKVLDVGVGTKALGTDTAGVSTAIPANRFYLSRFQASSTANITEIRVYSAEDHLSSNIHGAIYADSAGEPGAMIGSQTPAQTILSGWSHLQLPSAVSLTSGTYYWIGLVADTAAVTTTASGGTSRYKALTYGNLPDPAGSGFTSDSTYGSLSGYVGVWDDYGVEAGAIIPMPDGTFSMLYNGWSYTSGGEYTTIGLATSPNLTSGGTWTKSTSGLNGTAQVFPTPVFGTSVSFLEDWYKSGSTYYAIIYLGGATNPHHLYSSTDLINWTDQGEILNATAIGKPISNLAILKDSNNNPLVVGGYYYMSCSEVVSGYFDISLLKNTAILGGGWAYVGSLLHETSTYIFDSKLVSYQGKYLMVVGKGTGTPDTLNYIYFATSSTIESGWSLDSTYFYNSPYKFEGRTALYPHDGLIDVFGSVRVASDLFDQVRGVAFQPDSMVVSLESQARSDFNDVQFTKSDGVSTLYSWLESSTAGVVAKIWTRFDSIPASPSSGTFYLYFGNSGAASHWDGDNTFIFFDDFSGSFPGAKWTGDTGYGSVSGGILSISGNTAGVEKRMYSATALGQTTGAWRGRVNVSATNVIAYWGMMYDANPVFHLARGYTDTTPPVYSAIDSMDGSNYSAVTSNWTLGSYRTFDVIVRGGTNSRFFDNGTEVTASPKTTYPPNSANLKANFCIKTSSSLTVEMADWVLLRNYAYAEPTWGTWGAEEPALTNAPTSKDFGFVNENTTYYAKGSAPSNPVVDGDCTYTITNASGVSINTTIRATNPIGGLGWTLTSGAPGSATIRLTAYYVGQNPASGPILTTSDQAFASAIAAGDTIMWDFKLETGTFTDGVTKAWIITISGYANY